MVTTYKTRLSVWALALLLLAPQAQAQQQPADEAQVVRLMEFAANNAEFDAMVEKRAEEIFKAQIQSCKTPEKAVRQLPVPYGTLVFPDRTGTSFPPPTNGVWVEHVKIRGCGQIWSINMLAVGRESEMPTLLALLAGETLSDPATQRDAERIGITTIKKMDAESCADQTRVNYTKFLGFRQADGSLGKTNSGGGWFEEWIFDYCRRQIPVQMAYLPNGKGGFDVKARIVPDTMPTLPATKPASPVN